MKVDIQTLEKSGKVLIIMVTMLRVRAAEKSPCHTALNHDTRFSNICAYINTGGKNNGCRQYFPDPLVDINAIEQRDIEAGRRNEGDIFAGTILRYGRDSGVPTPVTGELYQDIERKSRGL